MNNQKPTACSLLGFIVVTFIVITGLSLELWLFFELTGCMIDAK